MKENLIDIKVGMTVTDNNNNKVFFFILNIVFEVPRGYRK